MRLRPLKVRPARSTIVRSATAMVLLLVACGCREEEQISRYSVSKEAATPVAARDDVHALETVPAWAWFLKLTGPADAVASVEEDFRSLAASTTINGESPEWDLPEGWSQQPGSGMRFATLTIDGSDPLLEVSVTKLPFRGERDDFLRINIDRWRGQLGLEPMPPGDGLSLAESAGELESLQADGTDTTVVDLVGTTEEFDNARMLAAAILPQSASRPSAAAAAMPPPVTASSADAPLTYDSPEQWQPGRMSTMRVAAFEVVDGDKKVEITIIPAGGDLLSNVNRWREQVGLERWTEDELSGTAEEVAVDGDAASYVRLEGADQTILAVVLPQGERSWFFKLMGDTDLARQEEERFKTFVESVAFK